MAKTLQEILELSKQDKLSLREILESYSHIELDQEEIDEAIIWAKRRKEQFLKEKERKEREAENRKLLTETQWGYQQTVGFMTYRAAKLFEGKFQVDNHNHPIFDLLCYFFSNDEKFLSMAENMGVPNPSLQKGIMLAGNFGVGKTWLMKLFSKNQRQVFFMRNAKEVANLFERDGDEAMQEYVHLFENASNDTSVFFQKNSGVCIDDLGTEEIKTHYGNKKNVIGDVIERRYAKNIMGLYFHATTNLTAAELDAFYGGRVVSRLREMVNFIELGGTDRRK